MLSSLYPRKFNGITMKEKASFRINSQLHADLKAFANSQGITTSQLIELACYHFMDRKPMPTKQVERHKKLESIDLKFCLDQPTYKKLAKIVQAKNSTLSQELNYRLSASLENAVFNDVELGRMWEIKVNVDRLGNLLKLAIDQKTPVNDELFKQLDNNITELRNEFNRILATVNQRTLK